MAACRGHERTKISKNKMAMLLKTSRTQVDRLLDRKTTSHFQACSGPRRWLAAGFQSSWFDGAGIRIRSAGCLAAQGFTGEGDAETGSGGFGEAAQAYA